jgi:hypothetical protein
MYFDTLTIAGILMVAPYALLPFLFGRELLRVADDQSECLKLETHSAKTISRQANADECCDLEPCR